MPKIFLSKAEQLAARELKKLHAELLAEGIRDKTVAEWLGCTPQNIGQLWKRSSFSFGQYLVILEQLRRIKEHNPEGIGNGIII